MDSISSPQSTTDCNHISLYIFAIFWLYLLRIVWIFETKLKKNYSENRQGKIQNNHHWYVEIFFSRSSHPSQQKIHHQHNICFLKTTKN